MVMLPKHVSVVISDSTNTLSEAVGFVTSVRGEESRAGRRVREGESEVTFINPRTGDRTVRVVANEDLSVTGC